MAQSTVSGSSLIDNITGKIETAYLEIHRINGLKREDILFPVQFNPAQIQIYASCSPSSKSNTAPDDKEGKAPKAAVHAHNHPSIEMTVTLLFDAVFPADSFMWEKYQTALSFPVATQNFKNVAAVAQKKVYSVQPHIEALIAALRNETTRLATFHWVDFKFSGQVNQIMSKYTMFSISGRPVRGEVTLRMHQEPDFNRAAQNWADDFQRAFGGKPSNSSLVRPGQKVSSLINFNF